MTSRATGSIRVIARGVNARLTSLRIRSWSGGSMKMMFELRGAVLRVLELIEPEAVLVRECLPVAEPGDDIVEPRQREESELLVAVAGRFVTQPPVGLERVLEELLRERAEGSHRCGRATHSRDATPRATQPGWRHPWPVGSRS